MMKAGVCIQQCVKKYCFCMMGHLFSVDMCCQPGSIVLEKVVDLVWINIV